MFLRLIKFELTKREYLVTIHLLDFENFGNCRTKENVIGSLGFV